MHMVVIWSVWGLPLGFSRGGDAKDWRWAVSLGPLHLIRHGKIMGSDKG